MLTRPTPLVVLLALIAVDASAAEFDAIVQVARAKDAELQSNDAKMRLRHFSEWLITRWQRAYAQASNDGQRQVALEGEKRAWARLAHWSGHRNDRASLAAVQAKLDALASTPAKRATQVAKTPTPSVSAESGHWLDKVEIEVEGEQFVAVLPIAHPVTAIRNIIPAKGDKGARVYFDVSPLVARREAMATAMIEHASVVRMRVGQFDADSVRIVLDIQAGQALPDHIEFDTKSARIIVGPEGAKDTLHADSDENASLQAIVDEIRREIAEAEGAVEAEFEAAHAHEAPAHPTKAIAKAAPATKTKSPAKAAEKAKPIAKAVAKVEPIPSTKGLKRSTIRAQRPRHTGFGVQIRRVVIDPGHGGKDTGAVSKSKSKEKDVNLAIAKRLGKELTKKLGVKVVYTRTKDVFVSLADRVAIANRANADLFISVHANAHSNRRVHGIETYYLNTTTSRYANRLAKRENSASSKPMDGPEPDIGEPAEEGGEFPFGKLGNDARLLLADLAMRSASDESRRLAGYVQSSAVGSLRRDYSEVKDLGVKRALFFVLLGARMPSVLIETGFMSHRTESTRLTDAAYQTKLASAIANGVHRFVRERNELARRF